MSTPFENRVLDSIKFTLNTGFTIAVAKTITHNLNTQFVNVTLFDTITGLQLSATAIGNRTANTIDITLGATLGSVDITILG